MSTSYNRRRFVKLSTAAMAGSAALISGINYGCCETGNKSNVTVWDVPGGEFLSSPDYQVTLRRGGKSWKPFTYYTFAKGVDKIIDYEGEGKYIKLGFLRLQSQEYLSPEENKDTYAHSWACFDFSGDPVEVEVKILRPLNGLTLPLKSCAVFPSPLGIECEIIGDDVIRFTLDKPAKIAVVPNYIQAMEKLEDVDTKEVFEGYRNPLFLFARNPETNVPSKNAEGTLVVKPGQVYGMEDFNNADIIYFEAGIHDYSKINPEDPIHYIRLKKGQTVYLEGGAYLNGVFRSEAVMISEMPVIRGRGTISGDKQIWTGTPTRTNVIINVSLEGIQITDPHNHIGTLGSGTKGRPQVINTYRDVAVVGAWHGNTDGLSQWVYGDDLFDGWHMEDCFCLAADTNMNIEGNPRIRNHTIWQLSNAEPLWIRNTKGAVIDGVNILFYSSGIGSSSRLRQMFNLIYRKGARPETLGNVMTVRNVVVDAPFIGRLFVITADVDTQEVIYKDVLFENIIVKTPHIISKSPIGLIGEKNLNFGKVVFRNLVINGIKVTDNNFTDYFDVLNGVTIGKEIIFE